MAGGLAGDILSALKGGAFSLNLRNRIDIYKQTSNRCWLAHSSTIKKSPDLVVCTVEELTGGIC